MLKENDNLKDEVESLQRQFKTAQATINQLQQENSLDQRNESKFEFLQRENQRLTQELKETCETRDEAVKQAFLHRQLTTFYKHREENADNALVTKLWEAELQLQNKDNQIREMGLSIQRMEQDMKQKTQPGKVIVDHYVLTPSMIVVQLQSKLEKAKRHQMRAEKKVEGLQKTITSQEFKITNQAINMESMQKLVEVNEQ